MRNPDDVAMAKIAVARHLARPDIGATHQRAFLRGLLEALTWMEGDDRFGRGSPADRRRA